MTKASLSSVLAAIQAFPVEVRFLDGSPYCEATRERAEALLRAHLAEPVGRTTVKFLKLTKDLGRPVVQFNQGSRTTRRPMVDTDDGARRYIGAPHIREHILTKEK